MVSNTTTGCQIKDKLKKNLTQGAAKVTKTFTAQLVEVLLWLGASHLRGCNMPFSVTTMV